MNNIESYIRDTSLIISLGGAGLAAITTPLIIYLRNRINNRMVELETLANESIDKNRQTNS